jgi:pSer/pThr/pTyr-binding forkhead associated (FHA) protein
MSAELYVLRGKQDGKTFRLDRAHSYSVGRRSHNDITLLDKSVSRTHCVLEFDGKHFWVVDQDSHNGTYVNGRRIHRVLLYDGDHLTVGKVELKFRSTGNGR